MNYTENMSLSRLQLYSTKIRGEHKHYGMIGPVASNEDYDHHNFNAPRNKRGKKPKRAMSHLNQEQKNSVWTLLRAFYVVYSMFLLFFLPSEGDTSCITAREASFTTNYKKQGQLSCRQCHEVPKWLDNCLMIGAVSTVKTT